MMFALSMACTCSGQEKAFHEKDTLPDFSFKLYAQGNKVRTAHLKDFKKDLILLDFWATFCLPCIKDIPRIFELQNEFKNKIQIFLVTENSPEEIEKTFKILQKNGQNQIVSAGEQLSFIVLDTVFMSLMNPSKQLGTQIWIDRNKIFQAATYSEGIGSDEIKAFLKGEEVSWVKYYVPDITYKNTADWISKRIGFTDHLLSYSFFSKFDEKTDASGSFHTRLEFDSLTKKIIGINCFNLSITELYRFAYYKDQNIRKHFIFIDTKEFDHYYPPENQFAYLNWRTENLFCYALKLPSDCQEDVFPIMQKDLDRFFGIKSGIEKRKVSCFALKRISSVNKIKTVHKDSLYDIIENGDSSELVLHNQPFDDLYEAIYSEYFSPTRSSIPFLNETYYKGNIDIELDWGKENYPIQTLRKQLQRYGLDIVEEYKSMNALVLKQQSK